MIQAKNNFDRNLSYVNDIGSIYDEVVRLAPTLTTQASQLLRSQFVLLVSALDTYIHDIVRIGILQVYQGSRPVSKNLGRLSFTYNDLSELEAQSPMMKTPTLEQIIRRINSEDSYQSSKSIEYALGLIGVTGIWSKLSSKLTMRPDDIKTKLDLIVRRRNQIAHESDYNPSTGGQRDINKDELDKTKSFILLLIDAIHCII